jgi:hypothetical protein
VRQISGQEGQLFHALPPFTLLSFSSGNEVTKLSIFKPSSLTFFGISFSPFFYLIFKVFSNTQFSKLNITCHRHLQRQPHPCDSDMNYDNRKSKLFNGPKVHFLKSVLLDTMHKEKNQNSFPAWHV